MGRFVKNTRVPTVGAASYGAVMPFGTSATRPTAPIPGDFRFNTDNSVVEVYYSGAWNSMTRVGLVTVVKDTFTGDGATTNYFISKFYTTGQEAELLVFVGGVHQNPGVAYTVNNNVISFTSAPPLGQSALVFHGYASTGTAASTSVVA
jgi:hypothetical protein